ncbi:cytochrome P450 [Streptomyces platensis]|uniref:cytochrome P450 n=1 Tax=Streptomyces platensis TaxID=58346 RepID=UPI002E801BD8|nr:cytochrome P450 [Streptomyces platensis]WUB78421.1 cytochrome P450 [Streptomyces platensis]
MTTDAAVEYHPLDPHTLLDPYPVYASLRATGAPVWNQKLDSWVLTSYRDCRQVLLDHENFAADWRRAGETVPDPALDVHTIDPPDHTAIYGVLADSLRDMASDGLAARTRDHIAAMLDERPDGPFNAITEFTEPLARWFIPEAIGVPPFDLTTVRPMAEAITQAMDSGLNPAAREPGVAAQRQLAAMIEDWVTGMDAGHPIRVLVANAMAAGVPRHIAMNSLRTLVVNAFTAVPASLGNALNLLSRDASLLADQLGSPEAIDRAPHEFFRYEAPIQGTTRLAVRDLEFNGVQVRRGQGMLMLFAAANRDPEQFDAPDTVRLDRWPNHHLTFGYGAHACTGSLLAHLLLRELLTVLVERGTTLKPAGPAVHRKLATVRTLAELPLELGK